MKLTISILLICLVFLTIIPTPVSIEQKITYVRPTPIKTNNKDCNTGVQPEIVRAIILSIYSEIFPSRINAIYSEFYHKPRYC